MGRLRFSLIHLIAAVAVLALDMAVSRSLNRRIPGSTGLLYLVPIDGTRWIPFSAFAYGVLPMASLLVLVAASQLTAIRATGNVSPRPFGFIAFGGLSVFLFLCMASLSPPAVQEYLLAISGTIRPAIRPAIGAVFGKGRASGIMRWIDVPSITLSFTLPELAMGMGGAWLTGRWASRPAVEVRADDDGS